MLIKQAFNKAEDYLGIARELMKLLGVESHEFMIGGSVALLVHYDIFLGRVPKDIDIIVDDQFIFNYIKRAAKAFFVECTASYKESIMLTYHGVLVNVLLDTNVNTASDFDTLEHIKAIKASYFKTNSCGKHFKDLIIINAYKLY